MFLPNQGTRVLIAGVVLVKDLYHMACVNIENVPSTSANNHVHPKAGKRMRQEPCCLIGAMASTAQELCTTKAALSGEVDK